MSQLRVTATAEGVRVAVRVQPRASHPGVGGLHGDALKIRVGAAPVDGAANDSVIEVLADALDVPRRAVRIVAGASSRQKVVEIDGVTPAQLIALSAANA